MNRQRAQNYLNELGATSTPFLAIVDFEMSRPLVYPIAQIPDHIHFQIGDVCKGLDNTPAEVVIPRFEKVAVQVEKYTEEFVKVQESIRSGDTYLINLTSKCSISTPHSLAQIYCASRAKYKLLYEEQFVVFSPECFVKIKDGIISSFPMKGTIDAAIPNAAQILLSDQKERAEHATIVDLIRNDLSRVAREVQVERFRYLDYIATNDTNIYQMSSEIRGVLPPDYKNSIGDILFALLPAGSISGAPKNKTLEIIRKTESNRRGYYTGVMVYFDGATLDSGVLIRFIKKEDDELYFHSGGGITFQSKLEHEYQELMSKVYVPVT